MITALTVHTEMALISPFISIPGDQAGFVHLVRDTLSHNQQAIWADMKEKGWKSKVHGAETQKNNNSGCRKKKICRKVFPVKPTHPQTNHSCWCLPQSQPEPQHHPQTLAFPVPCTVTFRYLHTSVWSMNPSGPNPHRPRRGQKCEELEPSEKLKYVNPRRHEVGIQV